MACPACESEEHNNCCGAGIEEGEICLFPNLPWIHDIIGSQLEHECLQQKGKIPEADWKKKWETRIAVGKHDLRRRGFD